MSCCNKIDAFSCCASDYLVCTCMGVMLSEISDAIDRGSTCFEKLQDEFMVGTGCSSCVPEITALLKKKSQIIKN